MNKLSTSCHRGFTILELMVVLIVTISGIGLAARYMNDYADAQLHRSAAEHLQVISDAAAKYVQDNQAAILGHASNPVPITVAMLKSAKYLSSNVADTNVYRQAYSVLAYKPDAARIEAMVLTTGGDAIDEAAVRKIAKLSGARGGYVDKGNAKAIGSYGGWEANLANYARPGQGHLATALLFEDGALVADYLYRSAVPGRPELNRMATNLDMGGKDIANVNAVVAGYVKSTGSVDAAHVNATGGVNAQVVNATGGVNAQAVTASSHVESKGEIYADGWLRTRGDTGWYSEKHGGGWYMSDGTWIRSYGGKNVHVDAMLQGRNVVSYERMTAKEFIQIEGEAYEGSGCSPNGLLGRAVDGKSLSCVNGVWTGAGGGALNPKNCNWYRWGTPNHNNAWESWWEAQCPAGQYIAGLSLQGHGAGATFNHRMLCCSP
ncbi:MAG: shufflon system plasmid conjugative transfer pilus tip adhesin PilV [Burkholderiaceae bacterium]